MTSHDTDTPRPPRAGAVDLGGSHVTAAVVELGSAPRIVARAGAAIDPHGAGSAVLATVAGAIRALPPVDSGWTVALPGPFDYDRGIGDFAGVEKFAGLAGIDLRAGLARLLGLDGADLRFVNDALAYGVGEWWASDSRPARLLCITLGTGVGSAFLRDGVPVESGPEVPPHGWVHLLEIDGGPLEDVVSTRAIRRRYGGAPPPDVREIADRARAGDARAIATLDAAMTALGGALAPWAERFGAESLVVGGSMSRSWDLLDRAFSGAVNRDALAAGRAPIPVSPARLVDDAPLIGAAELGARMLRADPE